MSKVIGIYVIDIIVALALSVALGTAYAADNKFPTITPNSTEQPTEQEIVPPRAAGSQEAKKEMDYSKRLVISFIPEEWVQIGSDPKEKESYWLNTKSLDPNAQQFVIVGMIQYGEDRIIQGIGTQVRRVFSEAIVECSRRLVFPLRDVYATVDFHVVGLHRHPMPQGVMILDEVPMFKQYPDAKSKICPEK